MAAARQSDDGDGEQPRSNTISTSDRIGLPCDYDVCCRVFRATGTPGSDSEQFRLPQGPAKPFGGTLMVRRLVETSCGRVSPKCILYRINTNGSAGSNYFIAAVLRHIFAAGPRSGMSVTPQRQPVRDQGVSIFAAFIAPAKTGSERGCNPA